MNTTVLRVKDLSVTYKLGKGKSLAAVQEASFELKAGETLGIVGESGCGKSSLVRAIAQLPRPTSGEVELSGVSLEKLSKHELRKARRQFPIVFQDPISSLNPRRNIIDLVSQPLRIQGLGSKSEQRQRAIELLKKVGIGPELFDRHPYELSGGQCQRVSIARALITDPPLLICDEPVSALDVSVQAQILNLLQDLKEELNLSIVFVSHDLGVVRNISDRVLVMYLGKIVELADADTIYDSPLHPYTNLLFDSIPSPDRKRTQTARVEGVDLPSPLNPPSGCYFSSRCEHAFDKCRVDQPSLLTVGQNHKVSCHLDFGAGKEKSAS